jgi:Holliday junction resolvasome RuvABC endonuclease subunit
MSEQDLTRSIRGQVIIGIDPGLECTGWVLLLPDLRCDAFGGIKTPATWTDARRITEIEAQLLNLLHQMRTGGTEPTVASVEQYVYQGKRSQTKNAFRISRLVGSIESIYRGEGLQVVGPTRGQALQSLGLPVNAKDADAKRTIGRLVKSKGGKLPSNEHSRAAYAAAMCGRWLARKVGA